MLEYFENQIKFINDSGFTDKKIKQYFIADNYFHKFLIDDVQLAEVFSLNDAENIIAKINKITNNLIVDYKTWPESNAIYLKCKIVKFHYTLHEVKLIKKFNNTDEYLLYCLDNVVNFSRELYPLYFGDWRGSNIAIQKDLSWILVDFEDIFNYQFGLTKNEFVNQAILNLVAGIPSDTVHAGIYNEKYAKEFIQNYFEQNIDCLNFIKNLQNKSI
tara:strand:- start:734 stop:1381 length:648 start_codon:yes stop_codon:yes gene_type:complete